MGFTCFAVTIVPGSTPISRMLIRGSRFVRES